MYTYSLLSLSQHSLLSLYQNFLFSLSLNISFSLSITVTQKHTTHQRFAAKYKAVTRKAFNLGEVDHVVLHSPYNKLVKKSGMCGCLCCVYVRLSVCACLVLCCLYRICSLYGDHTPLSVCACLVCTAVCVCQSFSLCMCIYMQIYVDVYVYTFVQQSRKNSSVCFANKSNQKHRRQTFSYSVW